jgi:hypothetical protein
MGTENSENRTKAIASSGQAKREVMRDCDEEDDSWFWEDGILECDMCGADLSLGYPDGDGCPVCLSCGGAFAPGSEECDFCKWYNYCAKQSGLVAVRGKNESQ